MLWKLVSSSPDDTMSIGCQLGSLLLPGDVVFLLGGLGAGKTRLAQGIAAALGVKTARSPSFALLHCYRGTVPVYHADLYRLASAAEVSALDLPATASDGVLLIEWAALAGEVFRERLEIELTPLPEQDDSRVIAVRSVGARYEHLAQELRGHADAGV